LWIKNIDTTIVCDGFLLGDNPQQNQSMMCLLIEATVFSRLAQEIMKINMPLVSLKADLIYLDFFQEKRLFKI